MKKFAVRWLTCALAVVISLVIAGTASAAVDPPKWVAALYVEAQKVVGLRWGPVPGATEYKVLRSTKAGADYVEVATVPQPQYLDAKTEPGNTYYYVLQAVAAGETSARSDEKSVAIAAVVKVEVVAAPSLDAPFMQESTEFGKSTFRIGLSWVPGVGARAIAYNVYRSTEPGKNYQMLTSTSENRVNDTNVEEGKTYYYVVSALDETFKESPYSAEKSATVIKEKKAAEVKKVIEKALAIRPAKLVRVYKPAPTDLAFNQPNSVAIHDGKVYICDSANNRIRVFSAAGQELFHFGVDGDGSNLGELMAPNGLAIDADGNVYVTSSFNNQVTIFDSAGNAKNAFFLRSKTDEANRYGAYGLSIRPGKNELWVGDLDHHLVEVRESQRPYAFIKELKSFKAMDQGVMKEIGISTPITSAFRPDGKFVVFDALAGKLLLFDPETLELIRHGGGIGSVAGTFTRGGGVAVDEKGRTFAVDKVLNSIQVFDENFEFLYIIGNADGGQLSYFSSPLTLAVQGDRIFVSDRVLGAVELEMLDEGTIIKQEIKN